MDVPGARLSLGEMAGRVGVRKGPAQGHRDLRIAKSGGLSSVRMLRDGSEGRVSVRQTTPSRARWPRGPGDPALAWFSCHSASNVGTPVHLSWALRSHLLSLPCLPLLGPGFLSPACLYLHQLVEVPCNDRTSPNVSVSTARLMPGPWVLNGPARITLVLFTISLHSHCPAFPHSHL